MLVSNDPDFLEVTTLGPFPLGTQSHETEWTLPATPGDVGHHAVYARAYDAAGNELNYWIEAWNPAGTSVVWVEVANAGTTNIDLYYGNPDVAATSDPDATFLFHDDFTDGTAVVGVLKMLQ